jgi:predicted kinase
MLGQLLQLQIEIADNNYINNFMKDKVLTILRGLPGCGKSTFAKNIGTKAICCADDYHMHNNLYDWKAINSTKAHEWCQRKCKRFMKIGANHIVIANTNTTEKEMKIYTYLAECFGYTVFSVIVENRHNGVNIHNVPEKTLEKMKNRFSIKLI